MTIRFDSARGSVLASIAFVLLATACTLDADGDKRSRRGPRPDPIPPSECTVTDTDSCPMDEFCDVNCLSLSPISIGICRDVPEICTLEYNPVCGCDGTTYGNACEAASARVSVAYEGECEPTGIACGGLVARPTDCADDEYCHYERDALCGAADATGLCTPRPEFCTEEYNPVCGCDGETYSNECSAAAAGVSTVHDGPCDAPCTDESTDTGD